MCCGLYSPSTLSSIAPLPHCIFAPYITLPISSLLQHPLKCDLNGPHNGFQFQQLENLYNILLNRINNANGLHAQLAGLQGPQYQVAVQNFEQALNQIWTTWTNQAALVNELWPTQRDNLDKILAGIIPPYWLAILSSHQPKIQPLLQQLGQIPQQNAAKVQLYQKVQPLLQTAVTALTQPWLIWQQHASLLYPQTAQPVVNAWARTWAGLFEARAKLMSLMYSLNTLTANYLQAERADWNNLVSSFVIPNLTPQTQQYMVQVNQLILNLQSNPVQQGNGMFVEAEETEVRTRDTKEQTTTATDDNGTHLSEQVDTEAEAEVESESAFLADN